MPTDSLQHGICGENRGRASTAFEQIYVAIVPDVEQDREMSFAGLALGERVRVRRKCTWAGGRGMGCIVYPLDNTNKGV